MGLAEQRACHLISHLIEVGADDDTLLEAAGRYTIENLMLNAVHEIGEWLRLDGQRLFPAHKPSASVSDENQGNGSVEITVVFGATRLSAAASAHRADDHVTGRELVARLSEMGAGARFTCLPGVTIAFDQIGPVITSDAAAESDTAWRSSWSPSTLARTGGGEAEVLALVAREVHQATVHHEVDRICSAFRLDQRQPWRFAGDVTDSPPIEIRGRDGPGAEPLAISIDYR